MDSSDIPSTKLSCNKTHKDGQYPLFRLIIRKRRSTCWADIIASLQRAVNILKQVMNIVCFAFMRPVSNLRSSQPRGQHNMWSNRTFKKVKFQEMSCWNNKWM